MNTALLIVLFACILKVSVAFQLKTPFSRFSSVLFAGGKEEEYTDKEGKYYKVDIDGSKKSGKVHETQLKTAAYGTKFFAADVGIPAMVEDYGGGDVGGNDYKDSLFHEGPRGTNKPKITDVGVVKLPSMEKVERGYSEAKAKVAYANKDYKKLEDWTAWSKAEDEQLTDLYTNDTQGRGKWTRISEVMKRSVSDCHLRWTQVLAPNDPSDEKYRNILTDSERTHALRNDDWTKSDFWDKETSSWGKQ